MKKIVQSLFTSLGIIVLILACTNKEINLVTNVELTFDQTNAPDGFVNELLPSTFTITPEAFLPEFEYFFQYEVLEGEGVFVNAEEETLPVGEKITLTKKENETTFFLALNYKPNTPGTHRVQVTASDNFEKVLTTTLTYSIKNLDITWEASTEVNVTPPGVKVPINILLENRSNDPTLTFQWRYNYTMSSGTLVDADDATILSNQFNTIEPGTYIFSAIPNEEGETILEFEVRDSNGQEVRREVSFDVSVDALSNDTQITSFSINNIPATITGTDIRIALPEGTDLTNLIPQISFPQNATITPESGVSQDFTTPVNYLVTAQDAVTTTNYTVTSTTQTAPSTESDILSFSINNVNGVITDTTITLELPTGTDLSNLTPIITISNGATITPNSGTSTDFSDGNVAYVVIAEDGTTQKTYSVTVTAEIAPSTEADILTFSIGDAIGVVNNDAVNGPNIEITVPYDSDITSLSPTITISEGATISPLSDTPQAFNGIIPTQYTVTAQDESITKSYDILVSVASNDQASIITFFINDIEGVISDDTIEVTLPDGTDLSTLTPQITLSENASVIPNSGELQDFSGPDPINYEVTAQDGTTKQTYEVTVISNDLLSDANEITTFSLEEQDGTIDPTTNTIAITVPGTTDLSSLTPEINVSPNATYTPQGAIDFTTNPTNLVVKAQDGTEKTWSIEVTKAPIPVEGVSITDPGISVLEIGDTIPLQSVIIPLEASNSNLTWFSSNDQIITVNESTGLIEAVAAGGPITITVETEDGGFTDEVSFMVNAPVSTLADIKEFKINGEIGTISGTDITLELAPTADLMNLTPIITISDGATVVPGSAELQDFSNSQAQPLEYNVTAENGVTTKMYSVTVTKEVVLSSEKDILSFEIDGAIGTINANSIDIEVPYGSNLVSLTPIITVPDNADVNPPSGQATAFNGIVPTTYTVTAEDGTEKEYTINIGNAPDPRSSENDITSFSIPGQVDPFNIDAVNHTITVTMPFDTDRTALTPDIGFSTGATIPDSQKGAQNFSTPFTYAVKAENEIEQPWIVTLNIAPDNRSNENDILSFNIPGQEGDANINPTDHTVTVTMPFGTNVTSLTPMITISTNAIVDRSGAQNFSGPVTYNVTAQNEEQQPWIVTLNIAPDNRSNENDILTFNIPGQEGDANINPTDHTVSVTMPFDTDRTALIPDISFSTGATIPDSQNGTQNFSSPFAYTVIAENETLQNWIVTVSLAPDNRSDENDILSFVIPGQIGITEFSIIAFPGSDTWQENITMPFGTDISALTPTITISPGATIDKTGPQDFSNGQVTYIVTAENGDVSDWIVVVENSGYNWDVSTRTLTASPLREISVSMNGGGSPDRVTTLTMRNGSGAFIQSLTICITPGGGCSGSSNSTTLNMPSDGTIVFSLSYMGSGGGGTVTVDVSDPNGGSFNFNL